MTEETGGGVDIGQILVQLGLQGGWGAFVLLVGVVGWFVLDGRLATKGALDAERADTERLQRALDLKDEALARKDATIDSLQKTVAEMTTVGRASMRVITAIQDAAAIEETTP